MRHGGSGQRGDGEPFHQLANQHHPAAIALIGNVPCPERQRDRGKKLHQAYQTEIKRAVGEGVNLPAHHDRQHLETKAGAGTRQPERDKRAVRHQRRAAIRVYRSHKPSRTYKNAA